MILDSASLRFAFGLTALTLLLLFYFVTYRSTRSRYSLWWCVALALFLGGSAAYLADGSSAQLWANPLGNVLLTAGGVSVWAGARSLRRVPLQPWQLAAAPAVTLIASVLDSPADNDWAGGPIYLAAMFLTLGLATRELLLLDRGYSRARLPLAAVSGGMAAYYGVRCIAFLASGPDGRFFTTFFGTQVTTLATMVLLVVVSFMIAATTRAAVRGALSAPDIATSVATLDAVIAEDLTSTEAFVTMFHARLCSRTGKLSVVDAGHGLAVLVRADGTTELMPSLNLPLGVLPDQDWGTGSYTLEVGDLVLVFSDGVLDLFDGTLDSLHRAAQMVSHEVSTAQGAVDNVTRMASGGHLADDVTVVAVRRAA